MLSSVQLSRLVEGSTASKALLGGLLPTNNNAAFLPSDDISTVTVVGLDGRTPVAFGAVNKFSQKQAYCMVGEVADRYKNTTVWCDREQDEKRQTVLKITKSVSGKVDHTGHGLFFAVFGDHDEKSVEEHVMQTMINSTLGNECFDLSKNMTIDIVGETDTSGWRDGAGFIVADKIKFMEITCERESLMNLASECCGVTVQAMNKSNIEAFMEYDNQVTICDRESYLIQLSKISGINGGIAFNENHQPCGYILSLGSRVLCCYGETEEAARRLTSFAASQVHGDELTMFVGRDCSAFGDELIQQCTSSTQVTRLHTRTTLNVVRWNKVYFPNIGLHIF